MNQKTKTALIHALELFLAELKEDNNPESVTIAVPTNWESTSTTTLPKVDIKDVASLIEDENNRIAYAQMREEEEKELWFKSQDAKKPKIFEEIPDSEFILPAENVKKVTKKKK